MRKNVLRLTVAALVLGMSPLAVAHAEVECHTTGWWWFKQTTCTYPHGEGALVIKSDYKGNVTSVERMPY